MEQKYLERAKELHEKHIVVDTHLDLAGEIYYRSQAGEQEIIKNHYLENWRKAGMTLIVSSIFLETDPLPEMGLRLALDQISAIYEDVDTVSDEVCIVTSQKELREAGEQDKIAIILYMEGLDCIGMDLRMLRCLYEMGIRGASLTWSRRNYLAEGCCVPRKREDIPGGLSVHGKEAVAKMEELGMFLDISHLNDDGVADIEQITNGSYIATHSNCRSVYFNYRNLTDEQMIKMAEKGGIMGLNGCECIAGGVGEKGYDMLAEHAKYAVNLIGDDHVGYGLDICYPYESVVPETRSLPETQNGDIVKTHADLPKLTAALLKSGLKEESVIKIMGENFYHYFEKVLPEK